MGAQQHQVLPGRPSSRPGPAWKAFPGLASNNAFKTTKDKCGGEKASIKADLPMGSLNSQTGYKLVYQLVWRSAAQKQHSRLVSMDT